MPTPHSHEGLFVNFTNKPGILLISVINPYLARLLQTLLLARVILRFRHAKMGKITEIIDFNDSES